MTTSKNGRRRLQPAGHGGARLPAEAFDAEARVALVLSDELAWVSQLDRGQVISTIPVQLEQAAGALSQFGAATGLLPDGCLFWNRVRNQDRVGVWLPPARRRLDFGGRRDAITVPMPGLVFVGQGRAYWIWAASKRPERIGDRLFHAPLPNVFDDGRICPGSVNFPACSSASILSAAALFFDSGFSAHLADGRVQGTDNATKFLRSLGRKRNFPMARLAPHAKSLGQIIRDDSQHVTDERARVATAPDFQFRPAPELGEGEPPDDDVWMGDGQEDGQEDDVEIVA